MERVSELILRHAPRITASRVLLVNPPRDKLLRHLAGPSRRVRASSQHYGDFIWHTQSGAEVSFDLVPEFRDREELVILFLPREKERLKLLLHAIAAGFPREATLWVAGENRAGIKSCSKYVGEFFAKVSKTDSARHCALFRARGPILPAPFRLGAYERAWSVKSPEGPLALRSLPGVFAHGHLDSGTSLLLAALSDLEPEGRVLDFACGCGVIGLSLLKRNPGMELVLVDAYSLALESSRRSAAANGLNASVLASDGLSAVRGPFDWIVSNPPFHAGVRSDLNVAGKFFSEAGDCLREKGKMALVCSRHVHCRRGLEPHFARIEVLREDASFQVLLARGATA